MTSNQQTISFLIKDRMYTKYINDISLLVSDLKLDTKNLSLGFERKLAEDQNSFSSKDSNSDTLNEQVGVQNIPAKKDSHPSNDDLKVKKLKLKISNTSLLKDVPLGASPVKKALFLKKKHEKILEQHRATKNRDQAQTGLHDEQQQCGTQPEKRTKLIGKITSDTRISEITKNRKNRSFNLDGDNLSLESEAYSEFDIQLPEVDN